jgi:hypothetical protein
MKISVLWALIGLNAILLFSFIGQVGRPAAARADYRRPADYLMIPGEVQGGPSEVVYILDTTDGYLGGMAYDDGSHKLQVMPSINLNQVFEASQRK